MVITTMMVIRKDNKMGWSSGSSLAEEIWNLIKNYISLEDQPEVAADFFIKLL